MESNSPRGSEWQKWDLHIHPPYTKLSDGYKTNDGSDPLDVFCDELEKSDVLVFGITDYFSFDSYLRFIAHFKKKYPDSKKRFFFNLELKLNESVNKKLEEVNIHLLFNPSSISEVEKFLSKLSVIKTGRDEKAITCAELKTEDEYHSATVTRDGIKKAFEETFGKKAVRNDHFLVITSANNEGIRAESGKKRKEIISDEIDKFSDSFFGGHQNVDYFLDTNRYGNGIKAKKKPILSCSDAHSFEDIKNFLGKRFVEKTNKNGKDIEIIKKDVTWIKADPIYEGLKQILYEPESGERVFIGPQKPDLKDDFKVIRKIKFKNSSDFPKEIEFSDNLCSIIGSRSSGKSALLAYIAHSIDPVMVENVIEGPGEGEQYRWERIKGKIDYSIEWANGKSNIDSPGNIVYIRQNYLFDNSKDSNEIKKKIEPVLFKSLPNFETLYKQTNSNINDLNNQISESIDNWFKFNDDIHLLNEQIKELGDKEAIKGQKKTTEEKIEELKKKYELKEEELKEYQFVTQKISELKKRCIQIENELIILSPSFKKNDFFTSIKLIFTPASTILPIDLQEIIKKHINTTQINLLSEFNKMVSDYKASLGKEKKEKELEITTIETDKYSLIEKHKKNDELQKLVIASNGYTEVLSKIDGLETIKKDKIDEIGKLEKIISGALVKRIDIIKNLSTSIKKADQSSIKEINFDLEYEVAKEDIQFLSQGINLKEITDYVKKNELIIDNIRNNPSKFLSDIYSGKQKINARYDKKKVAIDTLQLTEKILFTAQMEGDKIGGFSQSTMTPGKRALFLLRLILAESNDTWPLLIDQPEDDLDSRAIYDDIVPFLKNKKKERQIIMVSHNANLVIGSDSEQLIIANRNGNDRPNKDGKQFNYLTGGLEFSKMKDEKCKDTLKSQGVCEHACSILDGGKVAFEIRKNKYQIH